MTSNAEYMRKLRATDPSQRQRDRWWVKTRNAAMEQLAKEYPERFTQILEKLRHDDPGPWAPRT